METHVLRLPCSTHLPPTCCFISPHTLHLHIHHHPAFICVGFSTSAQYVACVQLCFCERVQDNKVQTDIHWSVSATTWRYKPRSTKVLELIPRQVLSEWPCSSHSRVQQLAHSLIGNPKLPLSMNVWRNADNLFTFWFSDRCDRLQHPHTTLNRLTEDEWKIAVI